MSVSYFGVKCCCLLFFDGQIKLQESPEDMPAGQTPHTTVVYAHNDLVDKVQPGDRINITGTLWFQAPPSQLLFLF